MPVLLHKIRTLFGNTMHRNSLYLMIAQAVMTGFGYLFWVCNARLYSSEAVGLAGTLISVSTLISQISILGLNQAVVRYLPKAEHRNTMINTCLWPTALASLVAAVVYTAGMKVFSADLLFMRHEPLLLVLFIASMILTTVNTFTDSIFLAYRATKYNVIIYTAYSVIRLALPFAFAGFGAAGIFSAHIAGVVIAVIASLYYMMKKFGYRPEFRVDLNLLRSLGKYSLSNYAAGFLWGIPLLIAPLLILNYLGPSPAAYFYMVMMLVNILQIIPTAITQALFAEGSHKENEPLRHLTVKSLRVSLPLEILAVATVCLGGGVIIGIFGKEYVQGGIRLLYILAAACVLVVCNMTGNVILKLKKRNAMLIAINGFGAAVTTGLFLLCMSRGLAGVGYGYLLGQFAQLLAFGVVLGPTFLRQRREVRRQAQSVPSLAAGE